MRSEVMKFFRRAALSQRGLTLIELTVVLGVIALIIGAIWTVAGATSENAKQYIFTQQLQRIVDGTRQVYQRINAFSGAGQPLTAILDNQGIIPVEMRQTQGTPGGNIFHQWNTSTNAGLVTVSTRGTTTFGVLFAALPQKACINLATKLSGGDTGPSAIIIGTTTFSGTTLPIRLNTASTACSSATNNTVEWQFTLRAQ